MAWTDDAWDLFERGVFNENGTRDRLYNPYATGAETEHDAPGAPEIRRANLRNALEAVASSAPTGCPDVLVVAEAPGPWGCRFSGIPFTNERQLVDPEFPVDGAPSSRQFAETGEPIKEYSGTIYWNTMLPYWGRFWTWNAVPFHPHKDGQPLTIRTPTVREIRRWHGVLAELVTILEPAAVVAVGRKAEGALHAIGADPVYIRHPSQGGATLFREGMAALWKRRDA